jgi:hypothetical protein
LAKNEEGEFELVLGNRQLISVFLIVVILLAVFFSMGYIVGRNSAPGATVETAQTSKPSAPESAPKESPSPPAASQESPVTPADDARTTTQPEKPAPARAERAPASAAVKESKPSAVGKESKASPPVKDKPEPGGERVTPAGEPAPGQYWQVVATARPDAEIIAEALTKKGFHALVVPAPRDGIFRVVVGPLKDAAAQAQTRTGLEAAGFKNPLMRKY